MTVCKECGEDAVETETNHGQLSSVCVSCGHIEEEGSLVSPDCDTGAAGSHYTKETYLGTSAPQHIQHCLNKRICAGQKRGLQTISELKSVFKMNSDMEKESKDLFLKAIQIPMLRTRSLAFKENLAGCCCYTVMRRREWPIFVNNICWAIGCAKDDLSTPMKMMTKHLNIQFSSPPVEDLIKSIVGAMKLDDKESIIGRAIEIVQLCTSCWLTTGRSPRGCVLIATYFAWQSISPSTRRKVNVLKFCKMTGIVHQYSLTSTRIEYLAALVKLANELPWVEGSVNAKNVIMHIKDIVKFQNTLKNQAVARFKASKGQEEEEGEEKDKLELFHKKFRKHLGTLPLDSSISNDISEAEIDSYIRSDKEVGELQKFVGV